MSNKSAPQFPKPHAPQVAQNMNAPLLNELQTEVSGEAAPFLQFLTTHALKIMLILGLSVLVVAGLGAYNWYQNKNMLEAQSAFDSITSSKKGEEQINALEEFLKKAPQDLHLAIILAQAEASMLEKSYDRAAEFYAKLAGMDTDGAVGLLASLNQGQALIAAQKYKEAIPVLEALLPKVPEGHSLVVQQALAEAALQSGDLLKAKNTFEAMANAGMGTEADIYRFRVRALEEKINGTEKGTEAKTEEVKGTETNTSGK